MSPLSFHTNLQADWCNDRSQRAKTHSGTPAKQQSATKSVILRKSILMLFFSIRNLVHFDTAHHAEHCRFTREDFLQPDLQYVSLKMPHSVQLVCFSNVLPLRCLCQTFTSELPACPSLIWKKFDDYKAVVLRPILWATLQIKSSVVDVYRRGVLAVFQHNHPYANNLRLSLLISLTGKQTDWAAYTQTQANGWLTRYGHCPISVQKKLE